MKRKNLSVDTILKIWNLKEAGKSWSEIQEAMELKNITTAMSAMAILTKYLEGKAPSEDHPLRNPAYAEAVSIIKKSSPENPRVGAKKSEVGNTLIDTVSLVEKASEPFQKIEDAFTVLQSTIIDFIVEAVERRSKNALKAQEAMKDGQIVQLKQDHALEIEKIKEAYQAKNDKLTKRNLELEDIVKIAKETNSIAYRLKQRFITHA